MSRDFQNSVKSAVSNVSQMSLNGREALSELKRVANERMTLSKMPTPPERELIHNPNLVADPKAEIAEIDNQLRWLLTNVKAVETVIGEVRASTEELLR